MTNNHTRCVLLAVLLHITATYSVVPGNIPAENSRLPRIDLIEHYFMQGFAYVEIVCFLLIRHGLKISLRQLKRILKARKLVRRAAPFAEVNDVLAAIRKELDCSGQCIGYRAMWRRLVRDHGLHVKRYTVMTAMRQLDPDGVALRKAHRLRRRQYGAAGPNYIWHVDGYDKLKPFGFCISGAIDGYSRRILWLEVSSSNNNPALIAKYYLETLKHIGCAPRLLRCDAGTENTLLSVLQPFFRYNAPDSVSGCKSFMFGKSVSNQRIEAWWRILRTQGVHWWINLFKDMRDLNLYKDTDPLHVECLRFVFMQLIQAELDRIAQHWNLHTIRPQTNNELTQGKPDCLFFIPELYKSRDYGTKIDNADVQVCLQLYSTDRYVCSPEFKELVYLLKPDLQLPFSAEDGLKLFIELTGLIEQMYLS